MKIHPDITTRLAHLVPPATLASWTSRLQQEGASVSFLRSEKEKMATPATGCSTTSKNNSAIERCRPKLRPKRDSPHKIHNKKQEQPITAAEGGQQRGPEMKQEVEETMSEEVTKKVLIPFKAVCFGEESEVPYLQASDNLQVLYSANPQSQQQLSCWGGAPLLNPPSSTPARLLQSLKCLHIYYQPSLQSLRQLGTGWSHLVELSIVYSSLSDLSGLSSFSSLQCLFVGFNCISTLSELMFHSRLRCLDLESNRIAQEEELEYLLTIERLEWVELAGNPVMELAGAAVESKLGARLSLEHQHSQILLNYQLAQMQEEHEWLGFDNIQDSCALISKCNGLLRADEVGIEQLHRSFLQGREGQVDLQIVRYEDRQVSSDDAPEEEEILFTPLLHFVPKQEYSSILRRYFQNKLYLTLKKQQKRQANSLSQQRGKEGEIFDKAVNNPKSTEPNQNRGTSQESNSNMQPPLRPISRLTRLFRDRQTISGEKYHHQGSSIEVTKKSRLSLGKPKLLLERGSKILMPPTSISSAILSTAASSVSSIQGLKRTSFLRRASPGEVEVQIERRMGKTGPVRVE